MLSRELTELQEQARLHLLRRNAPCQAQELARHLFGPERHETPEAVLVVRKLLESLPDVARSHDGRWIALDAPFLGVPLDAARLVAVDLETTGSLIGVDCIIEVGLAVWESGQVVQQFSSLVHNTRRVSPRIRKLTGIEPNQLHEAPPFDEVAPVVADLLRGAHAFVAHDVRFDLNFLRWELERLGHDLPEMPGLCTLQLAQLLWPSHDGWRLQDLAGSFSVTHRHPHRAGEDALATAGVLAHAVADAAAIGAVTLADLFRLPTLVAVGDGRDELFAADAAG
jgi:DNA polymerase III epsilon subunit family exonuclease